MKNYILIVLDCLNKSGRPVTPAAIFQQLNIPEDQWRTLLAYLKGKVHFTYAGGTDLPIAMSIEDPGRIFLFEHGQEGKILSS